MPARILIVEDDPLVTDAYCILISSAGYEVDAAATVAEAIERATSSPVDMMLLDLTLPDGDGLEILDGLRQRGSLPGSTIAMTGHKDSARRQRCLDAGCVAVLLKPVPISELLRQIALHLH